MISCRFCAVNTTTLCSVSDAPSRPASFGLQVLQARSVVPRVAVERGPGAAREPRQILVHLRQALLSPMSTVPESIQSPTRFGEHGAASTQACRTFVTTLNQVCTCVYRCGLGRIYTSQLMV
jgi:hypothetical protein